MIVESLGPLLGAIQGGSLKAIAVASARRLPNLPDLPTVAETIPGFVATGWFPLLAPARTPDWIVRKVGQDLRTVLDHPELRQKLADLATFAQPMSTAETTEFIRKEQELWQREADRCLAVVDNRAPCLFIALPIASGAPNLA